MAHVQQMVTFNQIFIQPILKFLSKKFQRNKSPLKLEFVLLLPFGMGKKSPRAISNFVFIFGYFYLFIISSTFIIMRYSMIKQMENRNIHRKLPVTSYQLLLFVIFFCQSFFYSFNRTPIVIMFILVFHRSCAGGRWPEMSTEKK